MSHVRILVHIVFATKNREPLLTQNFTTTICKHIQNYCESQGIVLLAVNGYVDHLHCLIDLQRDQNISMGNEAN